MRQTGFCRAVRSRITGVQFIGWFTKEGSVERWLKICEIPFKLFGWFLLIVTVSEAAKALSNPFLWFISIVMIISWSAALHIILLSLEEMFLKRIEKAWPKNRKWLFNWVHFFVVTMGTYLLSQYGARTLGRPLVAAVRAMLHVGH